MKFSQETIAIVAVGIVLAGLELHGRIEARAAREAISAAVSKQTDESRTAHDALRAEDQALRDAVMACSIPEQAQAAVEDIFEKLRDIAEHIEDAVQ